MDEPETSEPIPLRSSMLLLLISIAVLAGGAVWWFTSGGGDEFQQKAQLADLGALVVMDSDGSHVSSVTLSTINDLQKVREALDLAAKLNRLKSLDANRTAIGNAELEVIGTIPSLVSLSLKRTDTDDQGMANLSDLQHLESLHLNDTAITDSGLTHLRELAQLKILDLSGTQVSKNLSAVAAMPQLEWLVLGRLSLEDEVFVELSKAPSLKRVTLRDANYSESALEKLRQQRPGISVDE